MYIPNIGELSIFIAAFVGACIGSLAYRLSRSTESYLFKQVAFIILGLLIIYFAHRVNYTLYSRIASILFVASIFLLIYTYFFGVRMNEGTKKISIDQ